MPDTHDALGGRGGCRKLSKLFCARVAEDPILKPLFPAHFRCAIEAVKRSGPLHLAARRGNVSIAEALLECGANIEAQDSMGETPLRRAVNCGKIDVQRGVRGRACGKLRAATR